MMTCAVPAKRRLANIVDAPEMHPTGSTSCRIASRILDDGCWKLFQGFASQGMRARTRRPASSNELLQSAS